MAITQKARPQRKARYGQAQMEIQASILRLTQAMAATYRAEYLQMVSQPAEARIALTEAKAARTALNTAIRSLEPMTKASENGEIPKVPRKSERTSTDR